MIDFRFFYWYSSDLQCEDVIPKTASVRSVHIYYPLPLFSGFIRINKLPIDWHEGRTVTLEMGGVGCGVGAGGGVGQNPPYFTWGQAPKVHDGLETTRTCGPRSNTVMYMCVCGTLK